MANSNQIRLEQLTGSVIDQKPANFTSAGNAVAGGAAHNNLNDVLKYYASALARVNGNLEFGNQTRGLIAHDSGNVVLRGTDDNGAQSVIVGQADGTGADAVNMTFAFDGSTDANSTATITNTRGTGVAAVSLVSTVGGVLIDQNASGKKVHVDSEGSVDIDAVKGLTLSNASDEDGGDITIEVTGATDSSLHLASSGTAADALTIATSAGGMDITVAGAAAGEDLDISCNQEIRITSTSDAAEAIYLRANGGTSESIKIHSDQSTLEASLQLLSDAGGVDIDAAQGKNVDISGGQVVIHSKADASSTGLADAIKIETPATSFGGTADTMTLTNNLGTSHKGIHLKSAVGGLLMTGSAGGLMISGSAGASAASYGIVLSASLGGNLGGHVKVAAGGGARLELTGSSIEFHTADHGSMSGGIMKFATNGEFAQFIAKDNFSSTTSIIGAFNALADAGEPTKFVQVITASVASGGGLKFGSTSLTSNAILNLSGAAGGVKSGTAGALSVAEFHRMDVYLNGMLLLSGGAPDVLSGDGKNAADYHVNSSGQIQFGFALAKDDVVQVIDRS